MKGFGFATILFAVILVLLLVSVVLMSLTMYKISFTEKYVFDTSDPLKRVVKTEGKEAQAFWGEYKVWMIVPTVSNVFGMALLGLLYVMT